MTRLSWIVAIGVLVVASAVLIWPAGGGLRRLRQPAPVVAGKGRSLPNPLRLTVPAVGGAATGGLLLGGAVAAVVVASYGGLLIRELRRRERRQRETADRVRALDELSALAADLRAGLPPAVNVTLSERRLAGLAGAVWRLAERTGAPAADLFERIESDARAADRAQATAAAEAAGAQATAMLLAALPLGGIALGYSIGADPLQVLLHTKAGAACAIGAVILQSAGLLWCERLVAGPAR